MSFQPNPNDELTIGGKTYRVARHPAAPGIAHGQEGRAGIVYRLLASIPPGKLRFSLTQSGWARVSSPLCPWPITMKGWSSPTPGAKRVASSSA